MYKPILRPLLFRFESDKVHESTVDWAARFSKSGIWKKLIENLYDFQSPKLKQEFLGLNFRNPIGLAAGFDKNGTMVPLMQALGFGYVEVGSITANACTGNPKPRSFRLPDDNSIINRMGLNNDGAATIIKRLKNLDVDIPVGINIAKTHNPEIVGKRAIEDYRESFLLAKEMADYITLNISCPNTREGKTFETPETLESLLSALDIGSDATSPPVFIKFSVDLDKDRLRKLVEVAQSYSVNGYVATNTSVSREGLNTSADTLEKIGSGGLSGMAIRNHSTEMIREIYKLTKGEKLIIGVGGIFTAEHALEKIRAGADLLQIYTGMVYEGPSVVRNINRGLVEYLNKQKLKHLYQIRKS